MNNTISIEQLAKLMRGVWLMPLEYALGYVPAFIAYMKGENINIIGSNVENKLPQACFLSPTGAQYYDSYDEAPEGSISIIRVEGPIYKKDFYGGGTSAKIKAIRAADMHENIIGHIQLTDSPGGHVDGTKDHADAVKHTEKPLLSFVDGLSASAAYWINSPSNEIMLSNHTTMIGSIGTMISLMDVRGFLEKHGFKFHDVVAKESFEKNAAFYELLKGNYDPIKEQTLNPLNEIFVGSVRENRPKINEKALHGRMFLAKDAIKYSLADSIGTFEDAVLRVKELSKSANKSHSIKQTNYMFGKEKFTQLAKAAEQNEPLTEGQIQAINEELEAQGIENHTLVADSALQANADRITELEGQLEAANTAKTEAEAQLTSANAAKTLAEAERDAWKTKAEEYGSQPGATASEAQSKKDEQLDAYAEDWETIDNLPHNQRIDQNHLINQKK